MKKLVYSIFIALVALAASACDDDTPTAPDFAVSTAAWSFGQTEGMQRMIISAPDAWTITGIPEWMSVTPAEAEATREITIRYTDNETSALRTATLSVTCNEETLTISIEQQGKTLPDR